MARITYLTTIEFGAGVVSTLQQALQELGISRPLVVADRGIEASGLLSVAMSALPEQPAVFLDTPSNPTEAAVGAALALYRSAACDGIVAIGGGSPIDLAKGVALLASHAGPLEQYAVIYGGLERITAKVCDVLDTELSRAPEGVRRRSLGMLLDRVAARLAS